LTDGARSPADTVQDIRPNPAALRVCNTCGGSGTARQGTFQGQECDRCGGVGLLRPCRQRDCQEYGCSSFGDCEVSPIEAAAHGFPTGAKQRQRNLKRALDRAHTTRVTAPDRYPRLLPGSPVAIACVLIALSGSAMTWALVIRPWHGLGIAAAATLVIFAILMLAVSVFEGDG
jgi:hypothetical protein